MNDELVGGRRQALEACVQDTASFMLLFDRIRQHPQSALLIYGVMAPASMYVVESYRCLTILFPELQDVLISDYSDLLRASRHRAKLLDDSRRSIDAVTEELVAIAERRRQHYLEPHRGLLAPMKRALQCDMSLSIYDGHIFSTSHSAIFGFGEGFDFGANALAFGEAVGAYTAGLFNLLQLEVPSFPGTAELPVVIEMRDVKYKTLYTRGVFGSNRIQLAAGMVHLLAALNYTRHVLPGLLPSGDPTLFKLKFITAFHANSNAIAIQNRLAGTSSLSGDVQELFRDALGNADSRWLRKRDALRNLLTHYLPDTKVTIELPSDATRVDAIEHFGGGLPINQMDALVDRQIVRLSDMFEEGFQLHGDPFWFGRVSLS